MSLHKHQHWHVLSTDPKTEAQTSNVPLHRSNCQMEGRDFCNFYLSTVHYLKLNIRNVGLKNVLVHWFIPS